MNKTNDFIITEEGILEKYTGKETDVIIPSFVKEIGASAFKDCASIKSVTIPDSVLEIGSGAFEGCSSLESVIIPKGVKYVESDTFKECTGLKSVVVPEGVDIIEDMAFYNCKNLKEVTLPSTLEEISQDVFYHCTSLESITIPEGVTYIGDNIFEGCTSLLNVSFPDSLIYVNENFQDTAYYKDESNWVDGVLYCGKCIVNAKQDLCGTCFVKEGTKCIASFAFIGCDKLEKVILPDSVVFIGRYAFAECVSLTDITIPKSVVEIRERAFECEKEAPMVTIHGYKGSYAEEYAEKEPRSPDNAFALKIMRYINGDDGGEYKGDFIFEEIV